MFAGFQKAVNLLFIHYFVRASVVEFQSGVISCGFGFTLKVSFSEER